MGTKGTFFLIIVVAVVVGIYLCLNRVLWENKYQKLIKKVDHN